MLLFYIGFLEIQTKDLIDILLVAVLIFNLYKLIRGSVAVRVFVGFMLIYLLYLFVTATELSLLSEILGQFMSVGVIVLVILFQQEIKKFLVLVGRTTDFQKLSGLNIFRFQKEISHEDLNLTQIMNAVKLMSADKTGALIVFTKSDPLDSVVTTGDRLDAQISTRMITTIFFKNSPLHDGAMVIRDNRIAAARCILPVSEDESIPASLGLRHRASAGISEVADVVVLVVSEETGAISVVRKGKIYRPLTIQQARKHLLEYLLDNPQQLEKQPDAKPPQAVSQT